MSNVLGFVASFPTFSASEIPRIDVKALALSAVYTVAVAWAIAAGARFLEL